MFVSAESFYHSRSSSTAIGVVSKGWNELSSDEEASSKSTGAILWPVFSNEPAHDDGVSTNRKKLNAILKKPLEKNILNRRGTVTELTRRERVFGQSGRRGCGK